MGNSIKAYAKTNGLIIKEAKTPVVLHVKLNDVKKAVRGSPTCCAFARAIRREYQVTNVFYKSTAYLQFGDMLERYIMPPSMRIEVVSFDRSGRMGTGEYRLAPPSKSNTLKAQVKRDKRRGRHVPTGKSGRRIKHMTAMVRGNQFEKVA